MLLTLGLGGMFKFSNRSSSAQQVAIADIGTRGCVCVCARPDIFVQSPNPN